jgi:DNA-binding MarR family transcriptional regulator
MQDLHQLLSSLKKISRFYHGLLLNQLDAKGFNDLRASFLEILMVITKDEGATLKEVGDKCRLKKQTMTSHINELVKRGYLLKRKGQHDARKQELYFTPLGERLKLVLLDSLGELEQNIKNEIGELEFLRLNEALLHFDSKLNPIDKNKKQNPQN